MTKKKWIMIGAVAVIMIGAVITLSMANISMSNSFLDGEMEKAVRGDLIIPVTATGTVEANKIIQIKSKAGGQVLKIHVVEGQIVKEGDILVELDPVDEDRNVQARQADLDRMKSAFEKTKIALKNQRLELPLQTIRAKARLDDASFHWDKMKDYKKENVAGDVEVVSTKANFDLADADYQTAKNNEEILLKSAEQDVVQAEASAQAAQKALDEAKQRQKETKVVARGPGMVYSILIREGEMIQSGTQTFTGGTLLMTLADVSAVFVRAQVDEADIGAIRKIAPEYARPGTTKMLTADEYTKNAEDAVKNLTGKAVEATVDAYRSETYKGVIERILPEPQRVNNALVFNVLVRLTGEDLKKLIGLQADLSFTTEKLSNVILVKNEALSSEGRDCFVYVPTRKSSHSRWDEKRVSVKIGATDGTNTEIINGIKEGDMVWTKRPLRTEKEKKDSQNT
ncbi:MAG TPA: efflux RND transporter periplasmic adaptor subunit [Phycisphaerae bacterium]|nr:efflux RND transporter periplasmic adaptor subunit [Phycisphaerae bacterium]